MRIFSDYYPWDIEIGASTPVGVTMHDMFRAIWESTQSPIRHEDFWNSEMDDGVRARISNAYHLRCGDNQEALNSGVRRVDFFMDRVLFEGLVRTKDGSFEMKIKKWS